MLETEQGGRGRRKSRKEDELWQGRGRFYECGYDMEQGSSLLI